MNIGERLRQSYKCALSVMSNQTHMRQGLFNTVAFSGPEDGYQEHVRGLLNASKDLYGSQATIELMSSCVIGASMNEAVNMGPARANCLAGFVSSAMAMADESQLTKCAGALLSLSCFDPKVLDKYMSARPDLDTANLCNLIVSRSDGGVRGRNLLYALDLAKWFSSKEFVDALCQRDELGITYLGMQSMGFLPPSVRFRGFPAMFVATEQGRAGVLNELACRGHDVNVVMDGAVAAHKGLSVLAYAVTVGAKLEVVETLLSLGADTSVRNPAGRSLLQMASKSEEMKRVIRAHLRDAEIKEVMDISGMAAVLPSVKRDVFAPF